MHSQVNNQAAHRTKSEFNPELDGVRGLFMVAVFVFHCAPKTGVGIIDAFNGSLWPAIDVFFALSGFLITRNLLDDYANTYRVRNFYINRILRIFPAYFFALFIVFATLPFNDIVSDSMAGLPSHWWFLTYSFNFYIAINDGWPDNHLLNHFWSLCVEEQFYFIWPVVIYLFRGIPRVGVIAAFFLTALAAELYFISTEAHWAVFHTNFFTRTDSLTAGAMLAFLHRSNLRLAVVPLMYRLFYVSLTILTICAILKGGLRFAGLHAHLIVQPALIVWSSALIYLLINGGNGFTYAATFFRTKTLTFLGKYSYGIYIYHWLLYWVIVHLDAFGWRTGNEWLNFLVICVLTLAASIISYHCIEKWFLRLKARKFLVRKQSNSTQTASKSAPSL